MTDNDRHYLNAIRIKLERLYEEHPNDPALREQISDEIDWIDTKLDQDEYPTRTSCSAHVCGERHWA